MKHYNYQIIVLENEIIWTDGEKYSMEYILEEFDRVKTENPNDKFGLFIW